MFPVQFFSGFLVLVFLTCPVLSQDACLTGLQKCTQTATTMMADSSAMQAGPCKFFQEFLDCILALDCQFFEIVKKLFIDQIMGPLQARGINCGDVPVTPETRAATGTGAGTGTGTQARTGTEKMVEVGVILMVHQCGHVMNRCGERFDDGDTGTVQECSDVKKTGQCIFNDCPAIRGTDDEREAAKLLADFTSDTMDCNFTAGDFLNGSAVLKRPIWESLAVLLVAALVRKFLT